MFFFRRKFYIILPLAHKLLQYSMIFRKQPVEIGTIIKPNVETNRITNADVLANITKTSIDKNIMDNTLIFFVFLL